MLVIDSTFPLSSCFALNVRVRFCAVVGSEFTWRLFWLYFMFSYFYNKFHLYMSPISHKSFGLYLINKRNNFLQTEIAVLDFKTINDTARQDGGEIR